jgi:hypothetical protein
MLSCSLYIGLNRTDVSLPRSLSIYAYLRKVRKLYAMLNVLEGDVPIRESVIELGLERLSILQGPRNSSELTSMTILCGRGAATSHCCTISQSTRHGGQLLCIRDCHWMLSISLPPKHPRPTLHIQLELCV